MSFQEEAAAIEDWQNLEVLFRAFPSNRTLRAAWRQAAREADAWLSERHHHGLPALLPGLVHARLATALLAAGFHHKSQLQGAAFLCLGCHAGLEVRILRDLGAGRVLGVERRSNVVEAGIRARVVEPRDIACHDYWDCLGEKSLGSWDVVLALAPENLSLGQLKTAARGSLNPRGRVVVVAEPHDVSDVPQDTRIGPAMEGTMQWYRLV